MTAVACPVCGATGKERCSSASGRDHVARWKAEEAAKAASRPAREPQPWDSRAVKRVIRTEGRRVARVGTEVDLADLAALRAELEAAITDAVVGLRQREATWTALGEAFGVSRSAVVQRYGKLMPAE